MTGFTSPLPRTPARLAFAFIVAAALAGFFPLLAFGLVGGISFGGGYLRQVAGFTLLQAGLSTILSLGFAVPMARALARRRFVGRDFIVRLLSLPLALPAIVAVLGIAGVYGNNGWLGGFFDLYGLRGILLAHVFFNFPLAARLLLARLTAVPPESFRLAAQLGFRDRDVWWRIEWPQIAAALPGIGILIFLLCAASFTVVLTLGGGPGATTLEVAIYQALRFDFDPPRAVTMALVQLLICAILALATYKLGGEVEALPSFRRANVRYDGKGAAAVVIDVLATTLGLLILLPPVIAIVVAGISHLRFDGALAQALATSLGVGTASATLCVSLCWPLAQAAARREKWARLSFLAVLAGFIAPPAVIATGWFVLISRAGLVSIPAPALVIIMNSLMALPFVYNILSPAIANAARQNDRLCDSLGIEGIVRFLTIDLPALRQASGLALLMGTIVSLGDLTAILFFGSQKFVTLPALIYRQMGSYRMESAAGTALILALFTLSLIALADRWGARHD